MTPDEKAQKIVANISARLSPQNRRPISKDDALKIISEEIKNGFDAFPEHKDKVKLYRLLSLELHTDKLKYSNLALYNQLNT
ncbi:MAG: hypothetical protein ACHP6H_04730, partial [Legionellales bacterium]